MNLAVSGHSVPRPGMPRRSMRRRGVRRRGIILLLSLTLLTLFLMMLVTLIVITGQYRQSARVQARQERVGDPPHKLTDTALRILMVGDGVGASAATGHEPLRDVYGSSWRGVVTNVIATAPGAEPLRANPGSTGAFITFEFRRYDSSYASGYRDLVAKGATPGDHVGCLLTFVDGSPSTTKNVSVRILEFVPPWGFASPAMTPPGSEVGRLTIARRNPDDPQGLYDPTTPADGIDAISVGDEFIVNERAFSGYGAGYGPNDLTTTPPDPAQGYNISQPGAQPYYFHGSPPTLPAPSTHRIPKALAPHYRDYDAYVGTGRGFGLLNSTTQRPESVEYGGFNEDYDAVDYQNMFIAYVPPDATRADQIVPSFWRPELINYWRYYTFDHDGDMGASTPNASLWYMQTDPTTHPRMATDPDSIRLRNDFLRRICLRPLPTDHPEFTGSNPDAALPNDPAAPASPTQRFWQPLSLLTGTNDIDGNAQFDPTTGAYIPGTGADHESASGPIPWPPMPDERSTPPYFDPVRDVNANGILDQWDVDNDNDGITDSIWIDIGLPVQRLEDGKLYKPLVAFLIRDLDGLSNVNAHHHLDYLNGDQQTDVSGPLANTDGTTPINRPRGMGYGPAEIGFPRTGFGANTGAAGAFNGFPDPLFTNAQKDNLIIERYGVGDVMPGRPGVKDLTAILRSPTLPPFQYRADRPSEWGSPPDVWGAQAIALDYLGQPYNNAVHGSGQLDVHTITRPAPLTPILATEGQDHPYEIDLYAASSASVDVSLSTRTPDSPFTLAELERVLRWNDADSSFLPDRLALAATPAALADPKRRRVLTTHSSHIPTMPTTTHSEDRAAGRETWSLYHAMFEKLFQNMDDGMGNPLSTSNPTHLAMVDYEIRKMMPWEMWHGQKFDLNRRWQNGFDDNGNGTIDEPGEVFLPETVFPASQNANFGVGQLSSYDQLFDHLGSDLELTSNEYARQIYARHLYCLALFLMDYDPSGSAPTNGFSPADIFDDTRYPAGLLTPQRKDELFKRRLAQWAINVVDARDPDAICTPFEYDVNPYNGWQDDIDGNAGTFNAANPGDRRIVWGVEAPHLLITETYATHNRRVADTDRDDGDGSLREDGDTDLDQHRVPQGSLFVELMAVGNRAENDGRVPAELYDLSDGQLELGRTAPGGAAVWRIAISEPHAEDDVDKSAFARRDQIASGAPQPPTSYEPADLNLLSLINPSDSTLTPAPVQLQRFIHFANSAPTLAGNPATTDNTFYWRGGATKVRPGEYVVVAPREDTYFSLMDDDDWSTAPKVIDTASMPNYTAPGLHVDLGAGVNARNFNCNDNFQPAMSGEYLHPNAASQGALLRPIRAMICGANPPTGGWPEAYIGANISEPLPSAPNYYPAPDEDPDGDGVTDGYEPGSGGMAGMGGIPDVPFDSNASVLVDPMAELPLYQWGVAQGDADPLGTKTLRNWRTAFLQRLANPLAPFNAATNPYITVDFAPIDISVYNGDDVIPSNWDTNDGEWDPDDTAANNDPANRYQFAELQMMARERGVGSGRTANDPASYNAPTSTNLNADGHFLLWPHAFREPVGTDPTADGTEGMSPELQFRHNVLHTLGYLNVTMGMGVDPMLGVAATGYSYVPPGVLPQYYGAPPADSGGVQRSFPWLNWADRPFATPYELLSVPHSSNSTWFEDWSRDRRTSSTPPVNDPYAFTFALPGSEDNANFRGFYDHLLNFFHGAQHARSSGEPAESPRMYRLFDYVETPSPFVGSRELFHTAIGGPTGMDVAPGTLRNGNSYMSRFRDPGRVNLNTMPPYVWDGFEYAHSYVMPDGTTNFDGNSLAFARRGFVGLETWQYPTRIARPFRESGKADLAPLLPGQGTYVPERLRQPGIEGTLLRSAELDTSPTAPTNPLFAGPLHGEQFQSTNKNPYFRYEQLSRLPNLTTTQSNVYAVWMTVGYFEAYRESPAVRNPAIAGVYQGQPLPDGVWLGPELGTDTGNNRRHRAFYIIDRSIPVAFEPGNEHNFEKTILLRRYLD